MSWLSKLSYWYMDLYLVFNFTGSATGRLEMFADALWPMAHSVAVLGASTTTCMGAVRIVAVRPVSVSTCTYKRKTRKGALPEAGAAELFLHRVHRKG